MSVEEKPEHTSTSDVPDRPGPLRSWYDHLADEISREHPWYELPKVLGLAELIGIRDTLRRENLFDTSRLPAVHAVQPPAYDERFRDERTPDGSWNDLAHPEMGMAGTRFGRNVPLEHTWPDTDRMLVPNPRVVSRRLMTRERLNAATAGNAIIASWLQFMIHDWFRHGTSPTTDPWVLPTVEGDDWPDPPVLVMRTPPDPTSPPDSPHPPTYRNVNTHWWDGSSIYGSDLDAQRFLREGAGGRLRIVDGMPPVPDDPAADPTRTPGFWLGLGMMQTLFSLEHNAVAAHLAQAHPDYDDELLFQKARLVTCAVIAKIHTVEWTPAVTAHPTAAEALHVNWYGLAGEHLHDFVATFSKDEALRGIPGTRTEDFGVPYALTEEFVAVYRMHPLIPDDFDFRSAADDSATLGARQFSEITGPQAVPILRGQRLTDLLYTFGTTNPGLVTLHNYPRGLQTYVRPDGKLMDMAALDVLRCRELGVPRYCEFRRLLHLRVPESFADVTSNDVWARELDEVYEGRLEDLDLIPGVMAEDLPEGFAFSDTAFRIFVLMASRRLNSDRFFTESFTDDVYTPEGMAWVKAASMGAVLSRHCPDLAPYVRDLPNAFGIWARAEGHATRG
ncbi:peroxidase family protein [Cellulomonas alba]|uniref:Peroxidase family protein n=1 Tax=Cellulomonas alba TaxID=3053467 RepID=A0ABT7SJV4_9CELL|nr:peroxidase family protein [Cellulomonas alba]MDM7856466.1 peroxidase family protein [Cellulomonas alba]